MEDKSKSNEIREALNTKRNRKHLDPCRHINLKKMRDRNQQSKSEIEAENPKDRAKPGEHEEQRQDSTQN